MTDLVRETTLDVIDAADDGDEGFAAGAWTSLASAGLHLIGVPDELGGSGGTLVEAQAAVRAAAARACAVPLAEALFGVGPALAELGAAPPDGVGTSALFGTGTLRATERPGGWRLDGSVSRVPFASVADFVVVAAERDDGGGLLALCPAGGLRITPGTNLAGEPRDEIVFSGVDAGRARPADTSRLRRLAALGRAVQIAGAVDETVAITIRYANEREQFGRPIARFQAVAHQIAVMVGEAAVTSAAVDAAVRAAGTPAEDLALAAAKARASDAAGLTARTAHQVFGALGFTQEHPLHRLTRRLWSWRDEAGSAASWHGDLGTRAFAAGGEGLWPMLTDTTAES